MAVLSKRAESGERRREGERDFLDATRALLEGGAAFAELSVERIAEAAERPRTAFYLYFGDRRELLMRLTEPVAERLYSQAERWWGAEAAGGEGELRASLAEVLATYRENASLMRAVVEAAAYDPMIGEFWRAVIGRFVAATEERLRALGLPAEEARTRAFALVWMTERACYEHVAHGGLESDRTLLEGLVAVWTSSVDPG